MLTFTVTFFKTDPSLHFPNMFESHMNWIRVWAGVVSKGKIQDCFQFGNCLIYWASTMCKVLFWVLVIQQWIKQWKPYPQKNSKPKTEALVLKELTPQVWKILNPLTWKTDIVKMGNWQFSQKYFKNRMHKQVMEGSCIQILTNSGGVVHRYIN